jgi:5-methylcytosine-specific restriction endonuclease McrA
MSSVFVVDSERRPLAPVHPGRARRLLTEGKAAVLRRFPFTLVLKRAVPDAQPVLLRVKLDPGSKTTGIAVVDDATGQVVWAGEITHRGQQVQERLDQRHVCRRSRRQRHTRYRPPRFANRRRWEGWLPPSLESRIANVVTWVERLRRFCSIGAISLELVKFDMALMQNAEISSIQYQQGELAGFEVRQYLLEKFQRRCAYCGKTNTPFEVEHIVPKSRGGTDRVSNLCLACHDCNQAKGDKTAEEWGHSEVQVQAKASLKDAAAVNTTRWLRLVCAKP